MLQHVRWRWRRFADDDPLAVDDALLHPTEIAEMQAFGSAARRRGWRTGRAVAKDLLIEVAQLACQPHQICIGSRHESVGWPPWAELQGERLPWRISMAHIEGVACAAIAPANVGVGIDITPNESINNAFMDTWFHEDERQLLRADPSAPPAVIWSIKEAAFKAVCQGESFRPHQFRVGVESGQLFCTYRDRSLHHLHWEVLETGEVLVVIAAENVFFPEPS